MVLVFATEELLARIEVQLRARTTGRRLLSLADREVDLGRQEVRRGPEVLDCRAHGAAGGSAPRGVPRPGHVLTVHGTGYPFEA